MSALMLSQLHAAKVTEINKDERIPIEDVPAAVRRDFKRYRDAQVLCATLSKSIRRAGFEPDSGRGDVRRPYDWRRQEKADRLKALTQLKTTTQIELMKFPRITDRAVVMERYVKALQKI